MKFDEFLQSVSKIENIQLPAESSQFKMSPPFREQLQAQQKNAIKNAKNAGVVALFYPDQEHETKLVLILRKTYKGVHSAQVGFPGGKVEKTDATIKDAAIRETWEEVGVPETEIEILCAMTKVYIPPSNFFVYPFIGISRCTPKFVKQDTEVEDIIEVTLQDFISDSSVVTKTVSTSYSVQVDVPAFQLNNHIVWGATAMMLSEIKDLLKELL